MMYAQKTKVSAYLRVSNILRPPILT